MSLVLPARSLRLPLPMRRMVRVRTRGRLVVDLGSGKAALRSAQRIARRCADRIDALEASGRPLSGLAAVARSELAAGNRPLAAWLDSLALAALAAHRSLGQRPHLPQLTAAILAWSGRAAELAPGEGKTLALALAAVVHCLAGQPVHLVHPTAGAASRRAAAMAPLFQAVGIAMSVLQPDDGSPSCGQSRGQAYAAEVCYVAGSDLIFDSLRASATGIAPFGFRPPETVCALVDDLDLVLIDDSTIPYRLLPWQQASVPPQQANVQSPQATLQARQATPRTPQTTAQAYFRRYALLGGASSVLMDSRRELAAVYGLPANAIASIYPDFRRNLGITGLSGEMPLLARLRLRIEALRSAGRPVLIATDDDRSARQIATSITAAGLHVTLVADDRPDATPLSVCMRTADLRVSLDPVARAAGGLAVIAIGLPVGRRASRRIRALCARQGHPGSVEILVADKLLGSPLPRPLAIAWLRLSARIRSRREERARMRAAAS